MSVKTTSLQMMARCQVGRVLVPIARKWLIPTRKSFHLITKQESLWMQIVLGLAQMVSHPYLDQNLWLCHHLWALPKVEQLVLSIKQVLGHRPAQESKMAKMFHLSISALVHLLWKEISWAQKLNWRIESITMTSTRHFNHIVVMMKLVAQAAILQISSSKYNFLEDNSSWRQLRAIVLRRIEKF